MKFSTYAHIYLAAIGVPHEAVPKEFLVFGRFQHAFWARIDYAEAVMLFWECQVPKPTRFEGGFTGCIEELIYSHSRARVPEYFAKESIWHTLLAYQSVLKPQGWAKIAESRLNPALRQAFPSTGPSPESQKTSRKLNLFQKTACFFLRLAYSRPAGSRKT